MEFSFTRESFQNLTRRAKETARNAANAAKSGVEKTGEMVDTAKETIRLERACRGLAEKIDEQMAAIGELVYATHKGVPCGSEEIEEILRHVDQLFDEMDARRDELRKVKGFLTCPKCGSQNAPHSLYCKNCGKPLDVETI